MGFLGGVGNFFEEHWDDIAVGAAVVGVSFIPAAGPVIAGCVGAGMGGLTSGIKGENVALGAVTGAIPGVGKGLTMLGTPIKAGFNAVMKRTAVSAVANAAASSTVTAAGARVAADSLGKRAFQALGRGVTAGTVHDMVPGIEAKLREFGPIKTIDISKPLGTVSA